MSEIVSRFAPSPTGLLHLGHAWSAIQAYDRARGAAGRFLLRIEDIDGTRSRESFVAAIEQDLRWLGLDWDGPVLRQSQRLPFYEAALDQLRALGLLYPCFCTRAEIAASLSAPHGDAGPIYPGTCRHLPDEQRAWRLAGEQHAWRLDMAAAVALAGPLAWQDELAGTIAATPAIHGDVILARKDAPASYHLAVTVDDAAQGISHVVRGRDLFAATHVHRLLQALLGLPTPVYRHHALIGGLDGRRLAKRDRAPTLADLRAADQDGTALTGMLRSGRPPIGFSLVEA
ncbi:tRNA glutamyl-Q(34) synthetase GluQRS [Sphingomonas sp. AR_OL41]|uniref:tRNA glutamyl-Q(34) synthetase GluQRS n=1 Tax=Sphingomonas sp. AR_OL41 TaxID=3042729 RepID=UPI002480F9E9|nr:tRNA glutamyl-Q(34) synthetase GluQRS [Sphingomonas sp. AR_OL41]MDH7972167.1 tRNA glutamyl-Q(34) synthetase GluQRS [Sphingomonas sp. AR_OL41]